MKYAKLAREHFSKQAVFSITDLRNFFAKKGLSKNYSNILLHNMVKKGEIQRIARGYYSFHKDASIAGFAFSPFYYGLQEALSLRNLWEQETVPVILTPRKVRTGLRKILGYNVLIRRIKRKMFFGFELVKHFDFWLPVSDAEKTLVDFVYFKEPLPKQVLKEIKTKINRKKLLQYLKKCSKEVKEKVNMLLRA